MASSASLPTGARDEVTEPPAAGGPDRPAAPSLPPHGARQGTRRFGDGVPARHRRRDAAHPLDGLRHRPRHRGRARHRRPDPRPRLPPSATRACPWSRPSSPCSTRWAGTCWSISPGRWPPRWSASPGWCRPGCTTTATWWRWRSWPRPSSSSPARRPPTSCGPPVFFVWGRWRCYATARCRPGCCSSSRSAAAACCRS